MKQFSLPKNLVSTIHLWAGVLLILLAFLFTLLPMATISTEESRDAIVETADRIFPGEELSNDIPEQVKLSAGSILGSASTFMKLYRIESAYENAENDIERRNVERQIDDLQDYLSSDKGRKNLINTVCLYVMATDALEIGGSELITMILAFIVTITAIIFVVAITVLLPVIMLCLLILSTVKALVNIKTPDKVNAYISGKLISCIPFVLSFMIVERLLPSMKAGAGTVLLFIVCILAAILNFVVSRARVYPDEQFEYLNILQITSLAGVVGFMMFFFGILGTDAFSTFIHGDIIAYVTNVLAAWSKGMQVNVTFFIDIVLVYACILLLLSQVNYLEKLLRRFSCSAKRSVKKSIENYVVGSELSDCNIVKAISCIIPFLIINYVSAGQHLYENPVAQDLIGDASFIPLTSQQKGALIISIIGAIIMVASEIACIVFKKAACTDLSKSDMLAVLAGTAAMDADEVAETPTETEEEGSYETLEENLESYDEQPLENETETPTEIEVE